MRTSEKFAAALKQSGLRVRVVAAALDCTEATIRNWCAGKTPAPPEALRRLKNWRDDAEFVAAAKADEERRARVAEKWRRNLEAVRSKLKDIPPEKRREFCKRGGQALAGRTRPGSRLDACRRAYPGVLAAESQRRNKAAKLAFNTFYVQTAKRDDGGGWSYTSAITGDIYTFE